MYRMASWMLAAALVVAVFAASHRRNVEARAWEARVQSVEHLAEQERARADSATAVADLAHARAEVLASRAGEQIRTVRERAEEVRAVAVPDTCVSLVAPRDSLIDAALAAADTAQQAYRESLQEVAALRVVRNSLSMSNDSLLAVLQARPKPRAWWKPTLGVTAGLGVRGLDVVAGLTWEIRL